MARLRIFVFVFLFFASFTAQSGGPAINCGGQMSVEASTVSAPSSSSREIYFSHRIGRVEEHSIRKDKVAAHLYMDGEKRPYFFVAFPAGNSGVGLWFENLRVQLSALSRPKTIEKRNLNGIEVDIQAQTKSLTILDSVLGSMRFIRDRELDISIPSEVKTTETEISNGALRFKRQSLNGLDDYILEIQPINGTRIVKKNKQITFDSRKTVQLRVRAMSSELPLTPLSPEEIFKPEFLKRMDPEQVQRFAFLFFAEKWAAGSPRYLSNFGRDRLIMTHVLMDAFKPEALENILASIIEGMHRYGLVSHEQSEGDFASYVRMKAGRPYKGIRKPIEDYKMIDDDPLFTIVVGEYLKRYPTRAKSFLARQNHDKRPYRELLERHFQFIIGKSKPFSDNPIFSNLFRLKQGEETGQWRDSIKGLGGGVYPFDVNTAIVPGALKTMVDLFIDPHSEYHDPIRAAAVEQMFKIWNQKALPLFEVKVPADVAATQVADYAASVGLNFKVSASPPRDIVFSALALDAQGKTIPIMHSDDTLMMTFGHPSEAFLKKAAERVLQTFPFGLSTPIGLAIANPAFAGPELRSQFTENNYHGRVSWKMQEDLWIEASARQLLREDISAETKWQLRLAREKIIKMIEAKRELGNHEVFSLAIQDGQFIAQPFAADAKSNSNQGWSHLGLLQSIP